jgi:Radical SAM superfamily
MDFIFISMPYARFISRWFANVPNINLGIMQSYLEEKGKNVKAFHFHLDFLPYISGLPPHIKENLLTLTEQFGVEYMGLDYVFASLVFEDTYLKSQARFTERLDSLGLSLTDFEELRRTGRSFVDSCFSKLLPYLKDTRIIGFSCSHYQLSGSLLLCSKIKKAFPDILTVFGGKDCTGAFADNFMKIADFVDFTGTSECEVTVESLLGHINNPGSDFYNVVYRDKDGGIRRSPTRPNCSINSLPFPKYDFDEFPIPKSDIILPIEFGRGCPWKRCSFCPDESYNILCQAKSPERVTSEIAHYQSISEDLRNYFILDSDTLKDRESIIKISGNIQTRNLNFIYAEFRAEKMDRDVLRAVLNFGNWVSHFQIGIETFSDRMLQLMNKGVTILKNVEVLKSAAELEVPVQFNLFTCFPGMTEDDLKENIRVMDLITHILVRDTIQIFPGEFYLPVDSPIFLDGEKFGVVKGSESIFSSIFADFSMPSYSNYPYPYRFQNDEEQYRFSVALRAKVDEIKSKKAENTYMVWKIVPDGLEIEISRDSHRSTHKLNELEQKIYLSAVEKIRYVDTVSAELGISSQDVFTVLQDFEQKGIVLFSPDHKSFLSLATEKFATVMI